MEERFDFDYLVALLVAGSLVGLLAFVALALVVIRCKRSRQKRSLEGKQRMIRTRSGGDLSCTDSESTQVRRAAQTALVKTTFALFPPLYSLIPHQCPVVGIFPQGNE